jgi:hypothetical protein
LRQAPAFLLASVLHFYSGQPLQNLSGVDTQRLAVENIQETVDRLFPVATEGSANELFRLLSQTELQLKGLKHGR